MKGRTVGSFWQRTFKYKPNLGIHTVRYYDLSSVISRRWTQTAAVADNDAASNARPLSEMPAVTSHWILSVLKVFLFDGGIYKSLYKRQEQVLKKYGNIVRGSSFGRTAVIVTDPADVATVFRREPQHPLRPHIEVLATFRKTFKKEAGVFFLNGEKWHKHKSALSKWMLRPPVMKKYIPSLNAIADDVLDRFDKIRNPSNAKNAHEIDELDQVLFRWSFESVACVLFDKKFGSLSDNPPKEALDFINNIEIFMRNVVPVLSLPHTFYKYFKTKNYLDLLDAYRMLYYYADVFISEKMDSVEKHIASGSLGKDTEKIDGLIPFLLSSTKIQPDEIDASIVDTFFAGVDTTSNSMQWMLYLLAKNPDKQEILREEVDRVYHDKQPSASTLNHIPYLKGCIKETLRLYPLLISTERILKQETILSGYSVPPGTNVIIHHYAMCRRPDLFEHPNSFIPERWIRDSRKNDTPSFGSVPFGHGLRMCLGRRLAELELQLLTLKILKKYKLEYPEGESVGQFLRGINIPDGPLRVRFIDR